MKKRPVCALWWPGARMITVPFRHTAPLELILPSLHPTRSAGCPSCCLLNMKVCLGETVTGFSFVEEEKAISPRVRRCT
jgi:hypothetical protein